MYLLDNVSFIAHPNTGSRSMKKMVCQLGGRAIGDQHGICLETLRTSRAVVSVVRNPYDLLASLYWRMSVRPDFPVWLKNTLDFGGHEDPVGGEGLFFGLKHSSHVVRFENFAPHWRQVFEQLKLPKPTIPHDGAARYRRNRHYSLLYDKKTIQLVQRKYGDVLCSLNYKFEREE